MGEWGYVILAYGIIWGAILCYLIFLKRRYRAAKAELAELEATEESQAHAKE